MGISVPLSITVSIFFFLQGIQTFHFLVASAVPRSHTQRRLIDVSGFITIDCGFAGGSYYSPSDGFNYTSDEEYIKTGKNFGVSSILYKSESLDYFSTVRSFPEGRRNCYTLRPLKPNNKYLIRASFMYGNYDSQNSVPVFDVYIDVSYWFTFLLGSATYKLFREIIHVATTETIDVCLVNTGQGTPFISSLRLRPLDDSPYPVSPEFSLITWSRQDIGGIINDSGEDYYSMNDDVYDRLWLENTTWTSWRSINSTNEVVDASQHNPCKVPMSVLKTVGEHNSGVVYNIAYLPYANVYGNVTPQVYVYWHFSELELLGPNDTREFNIFVPHGGGGYNSGLISPKYLQLTTISSPRITLNESDIFSFSLFKTEKSNRYPILNAFELYLVVNLSVSPTYREDDDAITTIRDTYSVPRIWQGDPCLPSNYEWDGLNCTYEANNPPRITALSLSSSNLTGELPPSLSKLTSLKYLNLSNNGFTGKIPEFLAYMPLLNVIDLSRNDLMGPIPRELLEKTNNKSIDLRLEGNPGVCMSNPCEKTKMNKKRQHYIITVVIGVSSVTLLVIISIIFLAFKRRKKQQEGLVNQVIKPKNKQFSSSDIVRITDGYRKVVGKGGFGIVYYGVLQDGTEVAVKVLNNTSSTINLKQFCAEAELLTRIHHVNLVSLIGYCDEHANMSLVYEYMSCGNLQMHLTGRNEHPLSWKTRIQISVDAAQGLEYLHRGCRPPIIHRDIKPANILLDETGHAKIADFGLSRFFTANTQGDVVFTDLAGTRGYLDPEYSQLINSLSEKSDVYAFGIVLLQLLTGQPGLIKHTNDDDHPIHIDHWVSSMIESGDILDIVDKRLQQNLNVNSAWKFLEIAMECVKSTSNLRPRMNKVVADLKFCYKSEGFGEHNPPDCGDSSENYSTMSSQALEHRSLVSLTPSVR